MSSYPPPPDPQQFPSLYPPAPSTQLLQTEQEEQIHYTPAVPSSDFSKLEAEASEHNVFASSTHSLNPAQAEGQTKANRLRKACDSCSVRKVKVSRGFHIIEWITFLPWMVVVSMLVVVVNKRCVSASSRDFDSLSTIILKQPLLIRYTFLTRHLVRRVRTAMSCLYCSRDSMHIRTTD